MGCGVRGEPRPCRRTRRLPSRSSDLAPEDALAADPAVEILKRVVVRLQVVVLGLEDDAWMEGNERERRSGFCQKRDRGRKS